MGWRYFCDALKSRHRFQSPSSVALVQVDGQFFYNGSPWELKARDYASETLNAAYKELGRLPPRETSAVSATADGAASAEIDPMDDDLSEALQLRRSLGGMGSRSNAPRAAALSDAVESIGGEGQKGVSSWTDEGSLGSRGSRAAVAADDVPKAGETVTRGRIHRTAVTSADIIAVSAMEGVGVSEVRTYTSLIIGMLLPLH